MPAIAYKHTDQETIYNTYKSKGNQLQCTIWYRCLLSLNNIRTAIQSAASTEVPVFAAGVYEETQNVHVCNKNIPMDMENCRYMRGNL